MMKRLFDLVAAVFGLAVVSPFMALIAVAVKVDSPGPALFRQTRIGRGGRPFEILKFRTMRVESPGGPGGPQITVGQDPRVTRVGRFLRRTKLDELPQLVNVVRGEMSLVGPRPEVPRYVAMYPATARLEVLSVRPGITDDAAIEFSDESTILAQSADPERTYVEEILPKKIDLYLRYVRDRSLAGDCAIIWRTVARLVGGRPARRL